VGKGLINLCSLAMTVHGLTTLSLKADGWIMCR